MSMLSFLGSKKGEKKDDDGKKEEKNKEEAQQPRHFLHSWTIHREWVIAYIYKAGMMFCRTCNGKKVQPS